MAAPRQTRAGLNGGCMENQTGACKIWTCGVTRGDPGPAACAVAIQGPQRGKPQLHRSYQGIRSKIGAEFDAVNRALWLAEKKGFRRARVFSTSEQVAEAVRKSCTWEVEAEPYLENIQWLLKNAFDYWEFGRLEVRNPKVGLVRLARKELDDALKGFFQLFVDGSAPQNSLGSGPTGAGAVLISPQGHTLAQESWFCGEGTNNTAEYWALTHGLALALRWGVRRIKVYSDSQLCVRQILGLYQVHESHLKPRFEMARALFDEFKAWEIHWIERERNDIADSLAAKGVEKSNQ
jgi:ribonuclease HI